jgi:hypothetical protein
MRADQELTCPSESCFLFFNLLRIAFQTGSSPKNGSLCWNAPRTHELTLEFALLGTRQLPGGRFREEATAGVPLARMQAGSTSVRAIRVAVGQHAHRQAHDVQPLSNPGHRHFCFSIRPCTIRRPAPCSPPPQMRNFQTLSDLAQSEKTKPPPLECLSPPPGKSFYNSARNASQRQGV